MLASATGGSDARPAPTIPLQRASRQNHFTKPVGAEPAHEALLMRPIGRLATAADASALGLACARRPNACATHLRRSAPKPKSLKASAKPKAAPKTKQLKKTKA